MNIPLSDASSIDHNDNLKNGAAASDNLKSHRPRLRFTLKANISNSTATKSAVVVPTASSPIPYISESISMKPRLQGRHISPHYLSSDDSTVGEDKKTTIHLHANFPHQSITSPLTTSVTHQNPDFRSSNSIPSHHLETKLSNSTTVKPEKKLVMKASQSDMLDDSSLSYHSNVQATNINLSATSANTTVSMTGCLDPKSLNIAFPTPLNSTLQPVSNPPSETSKSSTRSKPSRYPNDYTTFFANPFLGQMYQKLDLSPYQKYAIALSLASINIPLTEIAAKTAINCTNAATAAAATRLASSKVDDEDDESLALELELEFTQLKPKTRLQLLSKVDAIQNRDWYAWGARRERIAKATREAAYHNVHLLMDRRYVGPYYWDEHTRTMQVFDSIRIPQPLDTVAISPDPYNPNLSIINPDHPLPNGFEHFDLFPDDLSPDYAKTYQKLQQTSTSNFPFTKDQGPASINQLDSIKVEPIHDSSLAQDPPLKEQYTDLSSQSIDSRVSVSESHPSHNSTPRPIANRPFRPFVLDGYINWLRLSSNSRLRVCEKYNARTPFASWSQQFLNIWVALQPHGVFNYLSCDDTPFDEMQRPNPLTPAMRQVWKAHKKRLEACLAARFTIEATERTLKRLTYGDPGDVNIDPAKQLTRDERRRIAKREKEMVLFCETLLNLGNYTSEQLGSLTWSELQALLVNHPGAVPSSSTVSNNQPSTNSNVPQVLESSDATTNHLPSSNKTINHPNSTPSGSHSMTEAYTQSCGPLTTPLSISVPSSKIQPALISTPIQKTEKTLVENTQHANISLTDFPSTSCKHESTIVKKSGSLASSTLSSNSTSRRKRQHKNISISHYVDVDDDDDNDDIDYDSLSESEVNVALERDLNSSFQTNTNDIHSTQTTDNRSSHHEESLKHAIINTNTEPILRIKHTIQSSPIYLHSPVDNGRTNRSRRLRSCNGNNGHRSRYNNTENVSYTDGIHSSHDDHLTSNKDDFTPSLKRQKGTPFTLRHRSSG